MFKVECPGCKAPYQVDERRIPSSGLKMRCPKCGTSFKVDPPSDTRSNAPNAVLGGAFGIGDGESAPPPALSAPAPAPRVPVDLRGTIVGVAPAAAPPRPAAAVNLKGTMMGVAPAFAAGLAAPPPRPNLKGTMMGVAPAPAAAAPGLGKPPPMPPRRAPVEPKPAPGAFSDLDLPAAVGRAPRAPLSSEADLPAAIAPQAFDDLPAAIAPQAFDDLPAAIAPQAFDDLPAAIAPRSFDDLPMAASGRPAPLDLDLDLPSLGDMRAKDPSAAPLELDLPTGSGARRHAADLPSLRAPSPAAANPGLPSPAAARRASLGNLPAVQARGFGEVELPSVATAGLPEISRSALPSLAEVELPSLGARARMPSGGFELDDGLPLVGGNLPALGGVGLPNRAESGLPARGMSSSGLPAYSATGLPSPSVSGLPSPGGPGLPMGAAGLPLLGSAGLSSAPPARPFAAPERAPSLPPDFGLDAVEPQVSRGAGADFGELELPMGGSPSAPPRVSRAPAYGGEAEEADLFGEAPIASQRAPSAARERAALEGAIVRQSGGGTAYGEVNLGDEGGDDADLPIEAGGAAAPARRDEDMEFGAIPQEDQPKPGTGPTHVVLPGTRAAAEILPRRKVGVKLFAGLFVMLVGGAALALVPTVGPFGCYFVIDHLKAGEYAALVDETVKTARADTASDTFPDAQRAIAAVETARAGAKRVRELRAFEAFTSYAEELRFGSDPAIHARASVLLDELADHTDVRYVPVARAARAAAEGQIARAKQLFDGLPLNAGDPDQALLRGEIALRAGDAKAATAVWQAVASAHKSPRAAFGLARASYAAGDVKAAAVAAREALTQNPNHVGARILLARIGSAARSGEADALSLLGAVTKDAKSASPDEIVSAQTLLGDIHLARSRMSQAEAAYAEALKINPKAARALNGLGDALYRAGRYSEAQARFEASTQADPEDLSAKIGVAKSKLGLERIEDASAMLKKLRDTFPQSIGVAYWYGRALEASGNRALAETVYRAALKSPLEDPQIVDVYIALALLQSQQGQGEEAQKTLAEARAKLPDLPAIHKALGDVALSQGRYPEATAEFRQAVALDSEDLGARFRLGVALRRASKFDEAGKAFDEVGSVDKEYPGLALERGLLYEASGRADEALQEYESALAKAPKDPDLMLRVGCGKVSAGRPKQAEELLRKVLSERPSSAETNHCLGRALLLEGTRLSDALRYLEHAVELDSNRAEYQLYVGWAANEAGNVPKAEHALAEALRIDQGLADAYWQRGVLRQRQGAARDAIADLTKALELRPSRTEAHAALADAYFDLGKEQQALSEWQLSIQAQPDNSTWRFRYGKLLSANHQAEASREQLTKALDLAANDDPPPRWAWEAHNLVAHAIGLKPEAVKHWEEFLRLGPRDSPYRTEAKASLEKLGHPWSGD
jgi:cellulose synthase operon protein C